MIAALLAALAFAGPVAEPPACAVTKPTLPAGRYGTTRLWVKIPPGGILHVQRGEDGTLWDKLAWTPDRDRGLQLTVSGRRLDAPGRMRVLGVNWGYSYTAAGRGKGGWASAVEFPAPGCWRITGRAGTATVSYVVKVVPS
jgi:hypothetical protein